MGAASILSLCSGLLTDEGPCVRSDQPRAGFVCHILPWLKFLDKSEADVCAEGTAGRVLGRQAPWGRRQTISTVMLKALCSPVGGGTSECLLDL